METLYYLDSLIGTGWEPMVYGLILVWSIFGIRFLINLLYYSSGTQRYKIKHYKNDYTPYKLTFSDGWRKINTEGEYKYKDSLLRTTFQTKQEAIDVINICKNKKLNIKKVKPITKTYYL